jgi:hypothetical protein
MKKIHYYITYLVLVVVVLNACTSIETKREAMLALLDATEGTTDIRFYADEFDENSLTYIDDEVLSYMAKNEKFANIEHLSIYNLNNVTNNGIKHLLKFKRLHRLRLVASKTITNGDLQLLSGLDSLTNLDIQEFTNIENLELSGFEKLELIDIQGFENLKNASFNNMPACRNIKFWNCPRLTAKAIVKINNCNQPSVFYCRCWNLGQVNIETNDSIWKVTVWKSSLAADGLSKLTSAKGLKTIDLSDIKASSLIVPELPDIEKLRYDGSCDNEDSATLLKLIVENSPKLSLIIITSNCLHELIVDTIPSLKSLIFSNFGGFELDNLNLVKFKNLEILSVKGGKAGKVLEDISQLSKLTDLELYIDTITPEYVKELAKNNRLESVTIDNLPNDESLASLFQSKSLKQIDVGESENITEVVIKNNEQLESFKAYSSGGIKKVAINNCKKLKGLDMRMCYPTKLSVTGADSLTFVRLALNYVENIDTVFRQINECKNLYSVFLEMPITDKVMDLSNLKDLFQLNFGTNQQKYVKKLVLSKELEGKYNEFYGYSGPIEYK